MARHRHHLQAAGLTEQQWRTRWEAARAFLSADGESGKRYGNETIRITPDGELSLKLPAPLAHLANAPHGRYVPACRVAFQHRGTEWADRMETDRAVAYRIHHDTDRGRWYVTASWTTAAVTTVSLKAARARGMVGVDTNADHLAAYHLDVHDPNPGVVPWGGQDRVDEPFPPTGSVRSHTPRHISQPRLRGRRW